MHRADRMLEIIQHLRRKKLVRAADLAAAFGVTERTIYRDVRDLIASGVPIEGEAGVGYVLRSGYDLPPLMFSESEIEALVLGARHQGIEIGRPRPTAIGRENQLQLGQLVANRCQPGGALGIGDHHLGAAVGEPEGKRIGAEQHEQRH